MQLNQIKMLLNINSVRSFNDWFLNSILLLFCPFLDQKGIFIHRPVRLRLWSPPSPTWPVWPPAAGGGAEEEDEEGSQWIVVNCTVSCVRPCVRACHRQTYGIIRRVRAATTTTTSSSRVSQCVRVSSPLPPYSSLAIDWWINWLTRLDWLIDHLFASF